MRIWLTLLWGIYHFFSIPFLLRTLFAPLMRTEEYYVRGFDPAQWAQTFVVNSVMRFMGMCARLIVLLLGSVALTVALVIGAVGFVVWLAWPIVLVGLFAGGWVLLWLGLRSLTLA